MIKYGKSLEKYERSLIRLERIRTMLYISKLVNQNIWINLWSGSKNSVIVHGIVKSIINGSVKNNKHFIQGCTFSFDDDCFFTIDDIFAISFKPFSTDSPDLADFFNNYLYGSNVELKSEILFSLSDLEPQDFNQKTPSELGAEFTGNYRKYNTRYYEILAQTIKKIKSIAK
jgi:hypothetical protein